MSEQSNTKIMQQAYKAFSEGDIPAVSSFLAEDTEYTAVGQSGVIPWAGTFNSHEQTGQLFTRLGETSDF